MTTKLSEKLTWAFGSGEQKNVLKQYKGNFINIEYLETCSRIIYHQNDFQWQVLFNHIY